MAAPAKEEVDSKSSSSEEDSSLFLEALSMPSTEKNEEKDTHYEKRSQKKPATTIKPLMDFEIPKPTGNVVSLMDLQLEPAVKAQEEEEEEGESADGRKEKKHYRPKKQLRNVFTRMEDAEYGPLSILYRSVEGRLKVKVWTRSYRHVRGICTGYIVAFDKHWNLAMTDVDEIYRKPFPRRTTWTMNVLKDIALESNGGNESRAQEASTYEEKASAEIDEEDAGESQSDDEIKEGKVTPQAENEDSDSDDLEARLQTLSLLREKLAQLDREEAELEAAAVEKQENKEEHDRRGTRHHRDERDKDTHRRDRRSPSDKDRERSPYRSRSQRTKDKRSQRRSSRSRERSPKSRRARHERRESPHRSSRRSDRKRDSPYSSRDHTPSRRHRNRDSPYSSRESSPSRRRDRTRRRSRSRKRSRSTTPHSDRDKNRKRTDLRERISSKGSSSKTKDTLDLREKLRSKKQISDTKHKSTSRREVSPSSDLDKHSSPSKNTRSRTKTRQDSIERDKDTVSRRETNRTINVYSDDSGRKSSRGRSEKDGHHNRSTKDKVAAEKSSRAETKSRGKAKPDRTTATKSQESDGKDRNKSDEPTFLTVGSKTIIKRHVNQLFIRGDNVVMVAIVD